MNVYAFDPLDDPRWDDVVSRHPKASIFHTSGWLRALARTYGFEPMGFTTSPPSAELRSALVLTAVRSWVTGRRLVSLPFSDHCEPLVDSAEDWQALSAEILRRRAEGRWKYVEVRPVDSTLSFEPLFRAAETFYLHRLDLRPDLAALRRGLHPASIQRKIRRAERERLTCQEGRSDALLCQLCHLLEMTRRRHHLPLQPHAWFRNIVACVGEQVSIRVASRDGEPVAGILTLAHRDGVVYKYGGSDPRLHPLGGVPFLFWKMIEDAKRTGARQLDLGRTDCDDTGLIVFKERWGAQRSPLTYWRAPIEGARRSGGRWMRLARRVVTELPRPLRTAAGRLLYRHMG